MAKPLYAWTFHDPFHSIFISTTTTISITSNAFLILITFSAAAQQMGTYKYLLAFFALCDIMTSIGHAVVQPVQFMSTSPLLDSTSSLDILGANFSEAVPFDTVSCLFFIATYYQTFLVLAFHFVYRYKTVTRGLNSTFKRKWSTLECILLGSTVNMLYIAAFLVNVSVGMTPRADTRAAVPTEISAIYGVNLTDTRNGFTYMVVRRIDRVTGGIRWNVESIIAFFICYFLIGATASVMLFCIYGTHSALKSAKSMLSATTKQMHRQIFNALLIQTAVPCLLSYAPLAICLIWPWTGISLGAFGNVLFLTTAIFPSIDAFFVLYFIRSFRAAVIGIFRLPCKESTVEPSGTELTTTIDQQRT